VSSETGPKLDAWAARNQPCKQLRLWDVDREHRIGHQDRRDDGGDDHGRSCGLTQRIIDPR